MKAAPALFLVVSAVATARADGDDAAERAFVEVVAPRDACFVHERLRLRVRIGFDEAFFRADVLQMFQRRLDVPARLDAPWLRGLPGATVLPDAPDAAAGGRRRLTFALGDDVVSAERVDDRAMNGRTFAVIEFEKTLLPERPGALTFAAPELRFAYATRFEDDFVRGRAPLDRRDAAVRGADSTVTVRPLPEDGRPAEFSGAVGRFAVRAQADRGEVDVGGHFKLTLSVEGDGDLSLFEPPRLDGAAGFHVYGLLDDRRPGLRVITYDVAALVPDVTETPSIPFASFDPGPPAAYRVERTPPIPLRVRAQSRPTGAARDAAGDGAPQSRATAWLVAGLAAAAAGAAAWLAVVRARRRKAADSPEDRIRAAADAFAARLDAPGSDVAAAFAQLLAACLDCPAAAVISPDLARRLADAGVPGDLAVRAASTMERLVAARYGAGAHDDADASAARALGNDVAGVLGGGGVPDAR